MDRNTILLTKAFTKIHLGTLLDTYGPTLLAKMIPSVYTFQYPYHFKLAQQNLKNGRPWHHLNKTSGKLKAKFKNTNLRKQLIVEFCDIETQICAIDINKISKTIQNVYRKIFTKKTNAALCIQKHVRRFLVRRCIYKAKIMIKENIDLCYDNITAEKLVDPCIIYPDYVDGNFVIYNKSTIHKLAKTQSYPLFTYIDEYTGQEHITYRYIVQKDIFHNTIYTSPYTRREFTIHDVVSLKNNMLYNIARKMLKC